MNFFSVDNWLSQQKDKLILWIPILLGIGASIYFLFHFEPEITHVLVLWGISLFAPVLVYVLREKLKYQMIWFFLGLSVFGIMSGVAISKVKTEISYTPIITKETRPVFVTGTISQLDKTDAKNVYNIILSNLEIENLEKSKTPVKIKIISRINAEYELGQRVKLLAKITPFKMPSMIGAYDFRRHYYFEQIGASGFVLKKIDVIVPDKEIDLDRLEKIRMHIGDRIHKVLTERIAGIANALITGERAMISNDDWRALRLSGLAHIISISGLHVVLFATPLFFFSRFIMVMIPGFALRHPVKKYAAIIALTGCSLYVGLVVPTVPTYRALLMTGIGLIAIMFDRSPFSLRLLSFSALVILILAPESIWSASFHLSFAAVLSLILSAEWTRAYWSKWRNNASRVNKITIYLLGSIFTTLVVSIVTAPLSSFHFQQIPIYGVVANALSIPLSGIIIMPMTITTFLLWPFDLQDYALKFMGLGIEWMLLIAHETASWKFSSINLGAWPVHTLIIFVITSIALILLKGKHKYLSLIGIVFAIVTIQLNQKPIAMISQKGDLILARDNDKFYISSNVKSRSTGNDWKRRLSINDDQLNVMPKEGNVELSNGSITCVSQSCRVKIDNVKISFGDDLYALGQECGWADYIFTSTRFSSTNCNAKIFNKYELRKTGAVEIYKNGQYKTVSSSIGKRPWSN